MSKYNAKIKTCNAFMLEHLKKIGINPTTDSQQ